MSDKDRINKDQTADRERARNSEFEIAGNMQEKGHNPSPSDRDRGEVSDSEPEEAGGAGGTRRR